MRLGLGLPAAIVLAWIGAPASAQSTNPYARAWAAAVRADPNAGICENKSGEEAIAGCTAAIQSGKLSGKALGIVFYGRGFEHQRREDWARAIADYSEAIRLNPEILGPFFNRGTIYLQQADYGRAIADFSEAIRLNPREAAAFEKRGRARRMIGKAAEGDADFAQACKLDSEYCETGSR